MIIDIGGGLKPLAGAENLDPVHGIGKWKRRAQDLYWPTGDWTAEAVNASHVMEHIPAGQERILVFNEAYRVLRPGGTFTVTVPLFPTWQALADPTHVSYWVPESFAYFDGSWHYDADYGIKIWETVSFTVREGWEGCWTGRKRL